MRHAACFLVVISAMAACAPVATVLVRADWVRAQTRGGRWEVLSAEQFQAALATRNVRRPPSLSRIPAPLLDAPEPITISAGHVEAFLLLDEPVVRIQTLGGAARVYWSNPYEIHRSEDGRIVVHHGSDVFIEGVQPGETQLQAQMRDGSTRGWKVIVHGNPVS